jgi:hypothetical protein
VKFNGLLALLSLISFLLFLSCTKVNEATDLGDDLIPAVDNVNTFDTTLEVSAAYFPFEDSSRHLFGENMALGRINDPVFGNTTADIFFNLSSLVYGTYPFITTTPNNPDSLKIDSVVLSLSYQSAYADTTRDATQISVQVSEITAGNTFNDTTLYRFDDPGFATGSSLGNKSFTLQSLKDSQTLIRRRDTSKVGNVLRIRLNSSLADKLKSFVYYGIYILSKIK